MRRAWPQLGFLTEPTVHTHSEASEPPTAPDHKMFALARRARPRLLAVGGRGLCSAQSFKAVVVTEFGGPEVLKLASRHKDELTPAAGQVLVRVHAAGVNPSDTYVRLGPHGPWAATPHLLPQLPFTPGKDAAGVVVAIGEGIEDCPIMPAVGSRVYTTNSLSGTYAEYALCEARHVRPLPDSVSFEQGACVGVPCATAHRALFTSCGVTAGDAVFLHGASGAVGLAAVQLAVANGCIVVGSAGSAEGEAAVLAAGAHAVVNHRSEGYLAAAQTALPTHLNGRFDLVLEMAAHANLVADVSLLRRGGQVAIIGSRAEAVALNPRLLMPNEVCVRGVFLPSQTDDEFEETHTWLYNKMARGALKPVVGRVLPLEDAPSAHVEVMTPGSGGKAGNVVISVG